MLKLLSKGTHKRNSKLLSTCFNELLEFNLKSFNDYLESCTIQNNEMKNIKNLNLKSNMRNLILPHHCSLIESVFIEKYCRDAENYNVEDTKTIINPTNKKTYFINNKESIENNINQENNISLSKDDRNIDESNNLSLNKKSENKSKRENKANLKTLEIKAIPFEWIFELEGRRSFIALLHNCDDLDIFSLQIIKNMIYFLWNSCRYLIILYLFVPYLIYFFVFVVYVTFIHKNKINSVGNYSDSFGIAEIICIVTILIFIVYQFLNEISQIFYSGINYFFSFWNLLDLSSLILNFTVCISDLAGISDEKYVPLSAIAILIVYLKLFYFGRIFISTASMIRMVIFIFYDMKYFLFIFLLVCFGFGNCYYILSKNNISSEAFYENTFFTAFLYAYQQALGAFDVSAFVDEDKHLLFFIWFFNSLILFIILLNMVVAAMGDTFDKVQDNSSNSSLKEIVSIMYENEILFNIKNTDKSSRYIIVIQEEKATDEAEVVWEGKINRVKTHLENAFANQNNMIEEIKCSIEKNFKDKISETCIEIKESLDKICEAYEQDFEMIDSKYDKKFMI